MSATWPYNSIYHILWRSKRFRALDGEDKLLLLWYMTNENRPAIGVYRAPDQYPAAELKWDIEQVIQSRLRLMEVKLIHYDDETEEVYVDQSLRFAVKPSASVAGAYRRQVGDIESDFVREIVERDLEQAEETWARQAADKSKKPAPQDANYNTSSLANSRLVQSGPRDRGY